MALPDQVELLCLAVQKRAAQEAQKILSEARAKRERLIQRGIQQIEREQEEQKLKLKRTAFQDARRKVDAAELAARRMVMATREKIFKQIMQQGWQHLEKIKADKSEYARILAGMMQKASDVILRTGSKGVLFRCSPQDMAIAKEAIKELPKEVSGKVSLSREAANISGGIMAYSEDGKQLIDLSFEAILKRIEPEIRAIAADKLFTGAT